MDPPLIAIKRNESASTHIPVGFILNVTDMDEINIVSSQAVYSKCPPLARTHAHSKSSLPLVVVSSTRSSAVADRPREALCH